MMCSLSKFQQNNSKIQICTATILKQFFSQCSLLLCGWGKQYNTISFDGTKLLRIRTKYRGGGLRGPPPPLSPLVPPALRYFSRHISQWLAILPDKLQIMRNFIGGDSILLNNRNKVGLIRPRFVRFLDQKKTVQLECNF